MLNKSLRGFRARRFSKDQYRSARRSAALRPAVFAAIEALETRTLFSSTLFWDPGHTPTANSGHGSGGSGAWNTTAANWSNGTTDVVWNNANNDIASFAAGSGGTATLGAAVSAAAVTFNATGYTVAASGTNALSLTNATSDPLTVAGGTSATVSSRVVGSGGLSITGGGTLILSGTDTFTGLQVNAGTLDVTGTLSTTGGGTGNGNYDYIANGGTNGGTANDSGTLIIDTNATFNVTGSYGDNFVIGRDSGSGTITQNAGSTFNFNPSSNKVLLIDASTSSATNAVYNLNGGALNVNGGKIDVGYGSAAGHGTLNVASGAAISNLGTFMVGIGNAIGTVNQNGGSIAVSNANPVVIANGAGNTGTYNLNGGTLTAPSVKTTGGSSTFSFNGGTLKANAASATFMTGLTTASVLANTGSTIDNGGFNITIGQPLLHGGSSADGGLRFGGAGTTTLSASNSYSGGTTISAGTLAFSADANLGNTAGTVTFNGGTLNYTNTTVAITPSRNFVIGSAGGTINVSGALNAGKLALANANQLTGTGTLTKTGPGDIQLVSSNSFSGAIVINGGYVEAQAAGAAGSGQITINSGGELVNTGVTLSNNLITNGGKLSNDSATPATFSGNITDNSGLTVAARDFWRTTQPGRTMTLSGVISGNGSVTIDSTGATSGGTVTLSGSNTFAAGTFVNSGTLQLGNSAAVATNSLVNVKANATIDTKGFSPSVDQFFVTGTVLDGAAGTVSTLTLGNNGGDSDFEGTLADGAGKIALVKNGNGTLTVLGTASYTGPTTVNSGIMSVDDPFSVISVNDDAILVAPPNGFPIFSSESGSISGGILWKITIGGATTGSASDTITSGGLTTDTRYVEASDWQAATSKVLSGNFTVSKPDGTLVGNFSYPGGGSFDIGTIGALESRHKPSDIQALGLSPDAKIIAFDDTDGNVDFNDDYWSVTAKPVAFLRLHNGGCDCPGCCGDTVMLLGDPVGAAEGSPHIFATDLASTGFTSAWSITRNFTTASEFVPDNSFGYGWMNNRQTFLQDRGGDATNPNISVVNTAYTQLGFDYNGSAYASTGVSNDSLTHNTTAHTYSWLDAASGGTNVYYDFSSSTAANLQGKLKGTFDAAGNQIGLTYSSGQLTTVDQTDAAGDHEYFNYAYATSGPNAGTVTSITQSMQRVGAGSPTPYRKAVYGYYQGTYSGVDAFGNQSDLKTVSIQDGSGNVIDQSYYRYFTPADIAAGQHGYVGGLKYVFNSDSFARLSAAFSSPFTATDTQVAPYADNHFQYDSKAKVISETAETAGASASGGQGTDTFSYANNPNYFSATGAIDFNEWWTKTTETKPDGSQVIAYTNANQDALLTINVDNNDVGNPSNNGKAWITGMQYNSTGRSTASISTSAFNGSFYTLGSPSAYEQYGDLGMTEGGVSSSTGLINSTVYASTTTATTSTAGDVTGYAKATYVQQGLSGTPIEQSSLVYIAHTDSAGNTIFPQATSTVYRNTNGTGAETTTTAYTFFSGTNQQASITTSAPVISSSQNGPGTADVTTDVNDSYGRVVWSKDADGFITYNAYDTATGGLVKTIQDVNLSITSDYDATYLPGTWTTPSNGGLNLVTTNVVDNLGRPTKTTSPNGNVSYVVYNDGLDPTTGFVNETRIYPGWHQDPTSGLYTTTGPVIVTRHNDPGSYDESLTYAYTPVSGVTVPTGTDTISSSNIQNLSRSLTSAGGQIVESDKYVDLTGVTYSASTFHLGALNTNYYATVFGYDVDGRQDRIVEPTGTIDRTVYDGLDRPASMWIGTDDIPTSGAWSPTNNSGANMTQVGSNVYDNNSVGDSNLTETVQYPNGSTAPRVTDFFDDWRDRLVATKAGVLLSGGTPNPSGETDGVHRPITFTVLDNLGEAVEQDQFDGDTVTITSTGGVPNAPSSSLLRAKTINNFDDQGREYQTKQYSVDPVTGAVSTNALTSNVFYDHRGDAIASSSPSRLWSKSVIDGAGRDVESYITDGGVLAGATGNWTTANSVTNDVVLSQTDSSLDADGNTILTADHERLPTDPQTGSGSTGALGNATGTGGPAANVYFMAMYYDAADRPTDSVNVGTNGGTAYTRPGTVPTRSDTALVNSTAYGENGLPSVTTDPRGIQALTKYDLVDQTIETVAAWDGTSGATPTSSTNQTTLFTFDGNGEETSMTAVMPSGEPSQSTAWIFGVAGGASGIFSNDLLSKVEYPDATTGGASTSASDDVIYTRDALGEATSMTDQNGSTHGYTRDVLGRETLDAVTTLGSGVAGSVRAHGTNYNTQGLPFQETSYSDAAATTIVNQDQDSYNGLGQLTGEYQEHSGAVNTSTTPEVQYAFSDPSLGSRQTSMTYPNGRVLDDVYNTGIDTTIGRVSSLADAGGSAAGNLQGYTYQGLATIVGNTDGNGVTETTTLDDFGRTAEMNYVNLSTGLSTDDFAYGYDRDGNVLFKNNLLNSSESELYHANSAVTGDNNTAYDPLDRLNAFERGTLSASGNNGATLDTVATASDSQSWNLNAVGDQSSVTTNGTTTSNSTNAKNELTANGANSLTFDNNGNTLTDENGQATTYDAWNHSITVKNSGGTTIASYSYDPNGWRTTESTGGTTTDVYFTNQWQAIEERQAGTVTRQNVFGLGYVNQLVERDDSSAAGSLGITGSGLGRRLYDQQDFNWSVTTLVDASGNVVQRMTYLPFGAVTFLAANWTSTSDVYAQNYLYQDGRLEIATGVYTFDHRDYDPVTGAWTGPDPAGYIDGSNQYLSDMGNPIRNVDPSGLLWSLARWIYTGDGNASDELYLAATTAGGDSYIDNAGVAHAGLQALSHVPAAGTVAAVTEAALAALEGGNLHGTVMCTVQARAATAAANAAGRVASAMNGGTGDGAGFLPGQIDPDSDDDDNDETPRQPGGDEPPQPDPDQVAKNPNSKYGHLDDPETVGPGKDFTPIQKVKIIQENKNQNGGVVVSDQSGTILTQPAKSQRGVTPDPNEWQIDHVNPRDKGGTNSYDNAQVLSRAENRAKSNK